MPCKSITLVVSLGIIKHRLSILTYTWRKTLLETSEVRLLDYTLRRNSDEWQCKSMSNNTEYWIRVYCTIIIKVIQELRYRWINISWKFDKPYTFPTCSKVCMVLTHYTEDRWQSVKLILPHTRYSYSYYLLYAPNLLKNFNC